MTGAEATTDCLAPSEDTTPQEDVTLSDRTWSGHPNSEMRAAYLRALASQPAAPRALD